MTEVEFFEYVEAVCKRPAMYTPTGAFFEAASFLEGLGNGLGVGGYPSHMSFTPFWSWFGNKMGIGNHYSFSWREFREQFPSDSEAFESLVSLYGEFVDREK
jgi:hypothetical protein